MMMGAAALYGRGRLRSLRCDLPRRALERMNRCKFEMNSPIRTRARSTAISLLLSFAACGFPRPMDVGDDVPGDSSELDLIVHVSPAGDDANDGLASPVKTLKHAIGIAAANMKITTIIMASGTYSASTGETFPYTVPLNVTIAGPAGGGAILAGSKAEPGMSVGPGSLQDLDLQDFTTAITVNGTASLRNIRVLTSTTAVQAETAAELTVDNLEIAGTAGACTTGIVLNGAAKLTATTLATHNLGTSLNSKDQSASSIADGTLMGDVSCAQTVIDVSSSARFTLSGSLLDGGALGIGLNTKSPGFQAIISNTIVRNSKVDALAGQAPAGGSATLQMTGGELSSSSGAGATLLAGTWSFANVAIRDNKNLGIYLQDGNLVMRGCVITGNVLGIDVDISATADLGTGAAPGGNVFQGNTIVGVAVQNGIAAVDAIGNTWNASIQGADAMGRYKTPMTIPGPVESVDGNNYSICNGCALSR